MPAPIRLPSDRPRPRRTALAETWHRLVQIRRVRDVRRFLLFSVPISPLSTRTTSATRSGGGSGSIPLRIRPCFLLLTVQSLVLLSLLGFHPTLATHLAPPRVPFSDKVLHFFGFLVATTLFYHVWVVEDEARRNPWWRWWNEGVCLVVCCGVGGIGSEYVQSLLPYKTFQPFDIVANVVGSALAIWGCHRWTVEHRRELELRRLYVRMGEVGLEDEDDDEEDDEEEEDEGVARRERGEVGAGGRGTRQAGTRRGDGRGREPRDWTDDPYLVDDDGGGGEEDDRRTTRGDDTPRSTRPLLSSSSRSTTTTTTKKSERARRENPWDAGDDDEDDDEDQFVETFARGGGGNSARGARGGGSGGGAFDVDDHDGPRRGGGKGSKDVFGLGDDEDEDEDATRT
ncbi:hypothetical protein JCM10212_003899 [Sporobolomyces blumeae]